MILEIDAGNTFIKWRLLEGERIQEHGKFLTASDLWPVQESWSNATESRIASVAGDAINSKLKSCVNSFSGHEPKFAVTSKHCSGVTNSYEDASRMGVDRWLVMLAAYNDCKQACCIVDCGSAITVDYVAANGEHLGGYIIPGLRLMNESLLANTAEIKVDQSIDHFELSPGTHTSSAVVHGVNYLFKALCEKIQSDLQGMSVDYRLYITGGDGELFHQLIGEGCYRPDLVMDGLSWGLS
jgi:type III pantothenate kinase